MLLLVNKKTTTESKLEDIGMICKHRTAGFKIIKIMAAPSIRDRSLGILICRSEI